MKTKWAYKVYLNGLKAILEVHRASGVAVYLIEENGQSELLQTGPFDPKNGEKLEEYFVDYLPGEALRTIDVLTTNFNYDVLIGKFRTLKEVVVEGRYRPSDFSMEMSYVFVDYEDVLKQLGFLTEEDQYFQEAKKADAFFQEYFYSRERDYTSEEFEAIGQFFDKTISYLESLKSN